MTHDEALAFLNEQHYGVLSTLLPDGRSHPTPIVFDYKDGVAEISMTWNRVKARNLERDPRATLCVMPQELSNVNSTPCVKRQWVQEMITSRYPVYRQMLSSMRWKLSGSVIPPWVPVRFCWVPSKRLWHYDAEYSSLNRTTLIQTSSTKL